MPSCNRPEAWPWHLCGLVAPGVILFGNLAGGIWTLAGVILLLVIYPILDVVTGTARRSHPPRTRAGPLDAIPYLHVVFHLAVMVALLWRALEDGNAWTTWAAALGSGLNTGTSAIVVAHELGHSRPLTLRWWLAKFNLLTALYLHFTLEHNRHHHPAVATTADPASAPRDRAFWAHLVRTVPGQLVSAWRISGKSGRRGLMNSVLHGLLLQTAVLALLWFALSFWCVLAILVQATVAVFLLEFVNYIQHYGLDRDPKQPFTEQHAWQSNAPWSCWTLLELPLHPIHHLEPSLRFWQLKAAEGAPTLPAGYYALFWPCLFPPLWRHWIHPCLLQQRFITETT